MKLSLGSECWKAPDAAMYGLTSGDSTLFTLLMRTFLTSV